MSWRNSWARLSQFNSVAGLAALLTLLALSGCATPTYQPPEAAATLQASEIEQQQAQALDHRLQQQLRLSRVAWPLLRDNVGLCNDRTRTMLGLQFGNSHSFDKELRDSAIRHFQLGEALQVLAVVPGSPAERAGIKAGDRLVSLNGQPFRSGKPALSQAAQLTAQLEAEQAAELVVYRQQRSLTLTLTPERLCNYPLKRVESDRVNAYADHRSIAVTEGMLDFTQDDRDLALVIAHELAHNLLDHIPGTIRNALLGGSIDLLLLSQGVISPGAFAIGGASSYSQAFEAEADYLSLYLLARAGYPLDGGAEFWRRMSQARPNHIATESGESHPGTAERFLRMQAAIEEIQRKRAAGEALQPTPAKPLY